MSSYNQKSFDACTFNPWPDGGGLIKKHPVLLEIVDQSWAEDERLETILRYTIMVYDPKSPLVIAERDLNFRKGLAAELAGFDLSQEEDMEEIYLCTHRFIVDLTCKFLVRFIKSKEWAAICAYEFKFWEAIRLIMAPIDNNKSDKEQLDAANKKDVLSVSIDEGLQKLEQYYRTFFGEDDELQKKAKKRMTPELMAEKNK